MTPEQMLITIHEAGSLRVIGRDGKPFTIHHKTDKFGFGLHGYGVKNDDGRKGWGGKFLMLGREAALDWLANLQPAA